MNIKELRIGNYIDFKGGLQEGQEEVVKAEDFAVIEYDNSLVSPIPLTEEWLLKFGFERDDELKVWKHYNFMLNSLFVMMDIDIHVFVQHVHQLQNLYFALTNKELILK